MKKKGFTLIELLAVIVILAIIAVIATPIIINVIESTKKSAANSEAKMVVSAIQNYCAAKDLGTDIVDSNVATDCEDGTTVATAITSGRIVDKGETTISGIEINDAGKVTAITVTSNGYNVVMTSGTWATAVKTS